MPLRLIFHGEDGRVLDLADGEHLVGSGSDVDVRLGHPTVSRRHARIVIGDGRATVEDLGSRNGTRVGGRRLEAPRTLSPPERLAFGTAEASLVAVDAQDVRPAIAFEVERPSPETAPLRATTVGLGALPHLVLDRLPQLLERVEGGAAPEELASGLGAALFEALPCVRIEIGSRGGLWFRADRAEEVGEAGAVVERGDVRVAFLRPEHARGWAGVVDIAALLLRLAGRARRGRPPTPEPVAPPELAPPDPPSVVPRVRELYAQAQRIAASDIGVVILGESGTGKELFARFLHRASHRTAGPFVALNCAALPRDLLESELFGIESGTATGVQARPGRFEQADGGTLFLDEIGDMELATQARILRALEEGEVYRLGGVQARPARVRVVAATNRDLDAMLADGSFRRDLYHRIADWRAELPPLRERSADIPNLAAWFLQKAARERGLVVGGISEGALGVLVRCDWPGNVRQLEREIGRASLFLAPGQLLESAHLQPQIREGERPRASTLKDRLEEAERRALASALAEVGGDVVAAAGVLDIGRSTFYRRMKELGIEP